MNRSSRLRTRIAALVAALALALPALAAAQSDGGETPGNYFGIGIGANVLHDSSVYGQMGAPFFYHDSVKYDTGWAAMLTFGRLYSSGWRTEVEFSFRRNDFDSIRNFSVGRYDATGDAVSYGLFFNGLYDFQTGSAVTPYLGLGIGALRVEYRDAGPFGRSAAHPQGFRIDDFDAGVGVQAIAGLKFNISDDVAMAVDYRYYAPVHLLGFDPTFDNNDVYWVGNTLMLTLQFGFGEEAQPAPPPAPVQPAPPPPPAQPIDSDNDGVNDDMDQCANTPYGTAVDDTGCPTDADNDGVLNAQDECPNTRPGVEVNFQGCEVLETRKLNSLHFAFDSAELTQEDMRYLDNEENKINQALEKYPQAVVEIAGYTDSVGTEEYNQKLSQRRTDSVRDYLVEHGVDPDRIISHGYGESDPVATNETREGRAQNRRVEVRLIGHASRNDNDSDNDNATI
ncbi:MAG TPA: OmpA family protein [Gammaproteobacteria bacterium]|nr:OmpA family protein [Gammaproteobacteria bacterium]